MAITAVRYASSLALEVVVGVDEKGNDKKKMKTISRISSGATDESLYNIGTAIAQVLRYETTEIHRVNKNILG